MMNMLKLHSRVMQSEQQPEKVHRFSEPTVQDVDPMKQHISGKLNQLHKILAPTGQQRN